MGLMLIYTTTDNHSLCLGPNRFHTFKDNIGYVTLNGTNIPEEMFMSKTTLKSVVIPEGVTSIDGYAFYGCTNLATVEIPSSVISINDCAFNHCLRLTKINIPNSVKHIGDFAFKDFVEKLKSNENS